MFQDDRNDKRHVSEESPPQLVSFPSPPQEEKDTAIGKLYTKMHKRIASIVTTATSTVMSTESAPARKVPEAKSVPETPGAVAGASVQSVQSSSPYSSDMSSFTFPTVPAVKFTEPSIRSSDQGPSTDAKAKRILPGHTGQSVSGAAPPVVQQVNAESIALVGDVSTSTPTSSPARPRTDKGNGNSTVMGFGFALQRELSSETDMPPTPSQMQSRRPSLIREDSISTVLNRLRSGRLSKKFWMKDENATACFLCDAVFSTFRRKHHCRLCYQIFCSNCTLMTTGQKIGFEESFRTCKTCHRILNDYTRRTADSDAPEFEPPERPRLRVDTSVDPEASPSSQGPFTMPNNLKPVQTPLMAIPAARTLADQRAGSKRLEIPNIQLAAVASPAKRFARPTLPLENEDSEATTDLQPSKGAAQWRHGLLGNLNAARPFKRRNTFQAASRTPSFESPVPSKRSETAQGFRSASEEEEWAGIPRAGSTGVARGKLARQSSLRESPYSVPDSQSAESRKSKRRALGLHARTKSRSLIRHLSIQGASTPSTPRPTEGTRSRGRSSFNSAAHVAPVAELNLIGRAHIKGLLRQLMHDAQVDNLDEWEKILSPILALIAEHIRPKVKEGASAYINNYVKIKRIPGTRPSQTQFISGVVFTNKLAHKRMARRIDNPRILLISFPLEYHRADSQLMSLEPIIAQENEYLQNLVNRMMSLRPTLVLIDRSVSGIALGYLLEKNVAVAYSVKPTVMAIVAELTGADIITSVDRLAFHPRVGKCESFSVKTYINHEPPEPHKKTYMFIQGCPPELGCTVVLRGAAMVTLEKLKRIMEFMIFVVYNQKLEASLIKDQHAIQRAPESFLALQHTEDLNLLDATSNDVLRGKPFSKIIELFEHRILSSSPGVQFEPPYILRKAFDLETRLERHKRLLVKSETEPLLADEAKLLYGNNLDDISDLSADQQRNVRQIVQAAEENRLQQEFEHVKKQWDSLLDQTPDLTSPWTRQSISVLYSTVCTESGTPCSLPQTEVIEYYKDTYNEFPLGQYVEECIIGAMQPCPTTLCQRRNMDHHRSYVHAEARVTVVTEPFPCHLSGMQDTILMWSYCKHCKITSPLEPMSDNSWAYSFGKYLELTFYDKDLCVRVEDCPHNLCRDHVRYFGFRDMAVRFDYDPIEIMALSVPQPRVEWKPEGFIRLKNEEFKSMQFKISVFYDSLEFRLYNMSAETLVIEQAEAYKADIVIMRQQAKDERTFLIGLLQEIYDNSPPLDYLCLNRALRATQEKVTRWNETFDELERLYLPSEKDIRRLTTAHLKKLFLPDEPPRAAVVEEEVESENKRSVSMPVALSPEKDLASEKQEVEIKPRPKAVLDKVIHPAASMLVIGEHDEEPKGFHPRRAYDDLLKLKRETPQEGNVSVSDLAGAMATSSADVSSIPKPLLTTRTKSEDAVPLYRPSGTPNQSRNPSVDLRHGISGIPILKSTAADSAHVRKRSINNNSHVLSKQIQDLGEAIVGSVEKRWHEQKRFSAQHKDVPQRNKAGETKVSSLAKHFDQLSREFEKERLKARKLITSRGRPTFAVATGKPKVAVFNNVDDAANESDDEEPNLEPLLDFSPDSHQISNPVTNENTPKSTPLQQPKSPRALPTASIPDQQLESGPECKELDGETSEAESRSQEPNKRASMRSEAESTSSLVPAAERTTLLKTLSNFWADRSSSAWTALEYPLPPSEHMFLESDVVIREDEPSSLIAFTLSAEEYIAEIAALREAARRKPAQDELRYTRSKLKAEDQRIHNTLKNATGTHMRFSWGGAGSKVGAKLASRIFFAEQFDALRRFCGCDDNYVASLSRCVKFDSSGGKSGAAFLKTLDDRLIVKQMTKMETEQFLKFAPNYFEYMAESFFQGLPTCLCKILGFYQITSKNPVTGKFFKMDVMVMENLFYKRKTSRIFDLKGSMRNRKVQQTGKENEVLLDENFVELVSENPLFVRDHARRFLKAALHNDTLFLAQNNVMDYSLVVGIDDDKHELIVGIIDFIRTYTWDKKLESWVKERGLVGGGSSKPTVVTPKQYKVRFREAMDRYIYAIK